MQRHRRAIGIVAAVAAFLVAIFCTLGYRNATADPVVRRATIALPDWPTGTAPVKAVLLSDIHVVGPDMPPARLRRIVAQVNALHPDMVFITGDFVSERLLATASYDEAASIMPLAGLKSRYGTVAVLGNHDHERGVAGVRRALRRAGILMLKDDAARIGPLVVGGTDDPSTQSEDFELTLALMRRFGPAPRVVLAHSPALFPFMPPDVKLMLAGHTHCGQIRIAGLPTGDRHCGLERRGRHTLITSAGLGASIVPLRFNAPPDIWELTLGR